MAGLSLANSKGSRINLGRDEIHFPPFQVIGIGTGCCPSPHQPPPIPPSLTITQCAVDGESKADRLVFKECFLFCFPSFTMAICRAWDGTQPSDRDPEVSLYRENEAFWLQPSRMWQMIVDDRSESCTVRSSESGQWSLYPGTAFSRASWSPRPLGCGWAFGPQYDAQLFLLKMCFLCGLTSRAHEQPIMSWTLSRPPVITYKIRCHGEA